MRNQFQVSPENICFELKTSLWKVLRQDNGGKIPLFRAPCVTQVELWKSGPRQRYLDSFFNPAAVGVPTVIRVEVHTGIPKIPEIEIRRHHRQTFHEVKNKV